jgi:hypothetical protein
MATAAEELAVFARGLFELFDLLFVTGQARGGDILAIVDHLGSMGIVVTFFAVC